MANLIRQIAPALRGLGEKLFGGLGIVAQFVLKLAERVGHLLFRRGQILQGQLVLAPQLAGAVVSAVIAGPNPAARGKGIQTG